MMIKLYPAFGKMPLKQLIKPYLKDTAQVPVGRRIIDNKNSGKLNVAPSISPDGKYLAFLSENGSLFTIDLFLADAKTGARLAKAHE